MTTSSLLVVHLATKIFKRWNAYIFEFFKIQSNMNLWLCLVQRKVSERNLSSQKVKYFGCLVNLGKYKLWKVESPIVIKSRLINYFFWKKEVVFLFSLGWYLRKLLRLVSIEAPNWWEKDKNQQSLPLPTSPFLSTLPLHNVNMQNFKWNQTKDSELMEIKIKEGD